MRRGPTPICDPITIAGIALTGLATGANYMGNQKVESARNDALEAERIRQQGLDQQAAALNLQSQDRYQGFEKKQDERAGSLADYYTQQQAEAPAASALPASASNITVAAENKARGKAKDRTNQIGTALGELRSFGDLLGDTSRLQARDASQIGQIGGFKRGSSNILGMELDEANNAGDDYRLFGDIAGSLGKVGVSAGLSGTGGELSNLFGAASPYSYGAGGYTGAGPFMPGKSGLFNLYGG